MAIELKEIIIKGVLDENQKNTESLNTTSSVQRPKKLTNQLNDLKKLIDEKNER